MGIPRLTSFLSPYAVSTILSSDSPTCPAPEESLGKRKVVIDGPSFAYYVYHILLASIEGRSNANKWILSPSYHDLGRVALAFLEKLEERGVVM